MSVNKTRRLYSLVLLIFKKMRSRKEIFLTAKEAYCNQRSLIKGCSVVVTGKPVTRTRLICQSFTVHWLIHTFLDGQGQAKAVLESRPNIRKQERTCHYRLLTNCPHIKRQRIHRRPSVLTIIIISLRISQQK